MYHHKEDSGGEVVKVSAFQPKTMIPHMTPVQCGSRKRTQKSDLSKL